MFFNDWMEVAEAAMLGIAAYVALVFFLRITGKRTLSSWNAFDFVVTVAFGSTLATTILAPNVSLAKGVAGLVTLILLQYVVSWTTVRSKAALNIVKSTPTLLWYRGDYQEEAMRRERITHAEVRAALRAKGYAAGEDVAAVVIETDGTFSVIESFSGDASTALKGVHGVKSVPIDPKTPS